MSNTSFWLIGDTPYNSAASTALDGYLSNLPADLSFVVHIGDIWRPKSSPELADYQQVAAQLQQSDKPVFIVPGDNEYDDASKPAEALAMWRQTFVGFENNWVHELTASRQATRPENFAFVSDGILYLGINITRGTHQAAQRGADNLAWINEHFAAYGDQVTAAVIFAQASPTTSGYGFKAGFVAAAQEFGLPILWAQGDSHSWHKDQPFAAAPNVTRVITAATGSGADSAPLKITITDQGEFAFDHGFPSNAPTITGTGAADVLIGLGGANMLLGLDGNDILNGGGGDDTLYGGAGTDALTGGLGNDTYIVDDESDTVIELAGQGTDKVQSSITYSLALLTNVESLVLTGAAAIDGTGNTLANIMTGNSSANTLDGGDGNDILDGGAGADILIGGNGNDSYVVDDALDVVTETGSDTADRIRSFVDIAMLEANVENLDLLGVGNIDGTGNTLINIITGNSGNNTLSGGAGDAKADTLIGGAGDDTYIVEASDKVMEAASQGTDVVKTSITYTLGANLENLTLLGVVAINGAGNKLANVITGNALANIIDGSSGNDTIMGLGGDDILKGGKGTDTVSYAGAAGAVSINLALLTLQADGDGGTDTLSDFENLTGSAGDDMLTGSNLANVLNGLAGEDVMAGGPGNDIYVVDDESDTVTELLGQGIDKVQSFISFNLALNGVEVENLELLGESSSYGIGNALANIITGNDSANILDGGIDGPGKIVDQLKGGSGNDTYVVRDTRDVVVEGANQGMDTVQSFVSYTLGTNVENLELQGSDPSNGTGNSLFNAITGNGASNILNGKDGDDVLTGGGDADVFLFSTKLSTAATSNVDQITDFEVGIDKIYLENAIFTQLANGELSSAAFTSNVSGSSAESGQTRIIYDQSNGFLYYDSDGSGAKEAIHFGTLDSQPVDLPAWDFFVV